MKYFLEVFESLNRQGPGSNKYTKKAYDMIKGYLPEHPKILDVGCGKGSQTFKLVEMSNGNITAIDNHQPFVDFVNQKAADEYIDDVVVAENRDMGNLGLPEGRFDVVWSEGAIYNLGFENGLNELKKFVKSMGFLVVSEAVWIKENPPSEIKSFWEKEYPVITSIENNLETIEKCGLKVISHFTLPEDAWTTFFYEPLEEKLNEFRAKNKDNEEAILEYNEIQNEINQYRKYKDFYSYEFFILKKGLV